MKASRDDLRAAIKTALRDALASAAVSSHRAVTGEERDALAAFADTAPGFTVGDYFPQDREVSEGCPWHAAGLPWGTNDSPDLAFARSFDDRMRVMLNQPDGAFDVRVVD